MLGRIRILVARKPLPGFLISVYLMVRWRCLVSLRANIDYPFRIKIGSNSRIRACRIIASGDGIKIGSGVTVHDSALLNSQDGNISIGDGTVINYGTTIYGQGGVVIGQLCGIAAHCLIVSFNHEYKRKDIPIMKQKILTKGGVHIEDDVWIGGNSTVLDGVTIHSGAVIGAASVVTKNIPNNMVAFGNPARVIRMRFDD